MLAPFLQFSIGLLGFGFFDMISGLVIAVTGIDHVYVVDYARILHAAIGGLDETVVIDTRIAAQRRDQSDVRTFRRFNWADAAVVRRMNVADFESRALTRQTSRP